ncbi:MAG: acyl-CoA synthetase, partial [Bacillota bacterium]
MKKTVAIVGDAIIEPGSDKYKMAFEAGKALVDNGYRVQSGGLKGIMEAAFHGAKSSKNYKEGDTLAILPCFDRTWANQYTDVIVATGLDLYRNVIVANADAVVAIGGGSGTLS